jgi:hypothetical protein
MKPVAQMPFVTLKIIKPFANVNQIIKEIHTSTVLSLSACMILTVLIIWPVEQKNV